MGEEKQSWLSSKKAELNKFSKQVKEKRSTRKESNKAIKEEKKALKNERKAFKEEKKEHHLAEKNKRTELLGQLKEIDIHNSEHIRCLTTKEKQNRLIKMILIISFIMILLALFDNLKTFISSGKDIEKVSSFVDIVSNKLNIDDTGIDKVINASGIIYRIIVFIKSLLAHWAVVAINFITLIILLISRLFLAGKERQIKTTLSIIINVIAVLVLFNLVLLLAELNLADIATNLKTHTIITLYNLIKKAIDMGLFIVEMILIIRYTLFVVRVPINKGE